METVTWTGAAGLHFETDDGIILIDPYHTRVDIFNALIGPISPDTAAIEANLPDMQKVKALIVGHTHCDHALDVPYIAANSAFPVVGSASLDTLMTLHNMPQRVRICKGGETVPIGHDASVTMIPSAHGLVALGKVPFPGEIRATSTLPMKASGYRVGAVFAPKLQIGGQTFLHVGSANFIESEINGHTCDVLFLCVPGWKHCPGYPQRLIELTQPRTVVLFHHDDFTKPHTPGTPTKILPFSGVKGMVKAIKSNFPGIRVCQPEVHETLSF